MSNQHYPQWSEIENFIQKCSEWKKTFLVKNILISRCVIQIGKIKITLQVLPRKLEVDQASEVNAQKLWNKTLQVFHWPKDSFLNFGCLKLAIFWMKFLSIDQCDSQQLYAVGKQMTVWVMKHHLSLFKTKWFKKGRKMRTDRPTTKL